MDEFSSYKITGNHSLWKSFSFSLTQNVLFTFFIVSQRCDKCGFVNACGSVCVFSIWELVEQYLLKKKVKWFQPSTWLYIHVHNIKIIYNLTKCITPFSIYFAKIFWEKHTDFLGDGEGSIPLSLADLLESAVPPFSSAVFSSIHSKHTWSWGDWGKGNNIVKPGMFGEREI